MEKQLFFVSTVPYSLISIIIFTVFLLRSSRLHLKGFPVAYSFTNSLCSPFWSTGRYHDAKCTDRCICRRKITKWIQNFLYLSSLTNSNSKCHESRCFLWYIIASPVPTAVVTSAWPKVLSFARSISSPVTLLDPSPRPSFYSIGFINQKNIKRKSFLIVCSQLYKLLCQSVRWSVGPSLTTSLSDGLAQRC